MEKAGNLYIGVDVGTSSVRAGLFTTDGLLVRNGYSSREIRTWRDAELAEQSTDNIWNNVCDVIKEVCSEVSDCSTIKGIGFDATCSLAVVSSSGQPVTVSLSKDPQRNVILWQDHRAISEANVINSKKHPVLQFVGGRISPEMQAPKLLWLRRNLYEDCWKKAGHFFDLADFLTYQATGATSRSLCCVVCKWTYVGHHQVDGRLTHGWNPSFWNEIGLEDLVDEEFARIGTDVLPPGHPVANGLLPDIAEKVGLLPGTPVATAIIDAHAGGLGMIGANFSVAKQIASTSLTSRLALIAGTSSCHMATSDDLVYVPGVWGPYKSAMVPGMYLNEGGQTTTGQLIDYVLKKENSLYQELKRRVNDGSYSEYEVYKELDRVLNSLAASKSLSNISQLTSELHILPDFLGNRSPIADPTIKGMYGTRHIIEAMNKSGHDIKVILVCGGVSKNRLYRQIHADVTGLPVVMTEEKESVLVGSAILGAAASGDKIVEAMHRMSRVDVNSVMQPCLEPAVQRFHQKKFSVFCRMYKDQLRYKKMMEEELS